MSADVIQWAIRWGISYEAVADLANIIGAGDETVGGGTWGTVRRPDGTTVTKGMSEAYTQSIVRLEAPMAGVKLFRNNVGVLMNEAGTPVRYGLANDSKAVNKRYKSGDLIGWRTVLITSAMVGHLIAKFVSRECKPPGWRFSGDDHELAQQRWAQMVTLAGGDACFVTGRGTL